MKIVIAGYGAEGRSNYRYFKDKGEATIADERTIIDDLPPGVPVILGPEAFTKLNGFDLVIRTAGLSPHKIKTDGKIWSATNEFFKECRTPIIGVTGSKGKGTTCSLIQSILKAAGLNAPLIGNIGQPALDALDEASKADVIVYELSSFQLWDIERSPQIAVVLGIEHDHLDVHKDMDEYVSAKANIRRFQHASDHCYYHPTNPYSRQIAITHVVKQGSDGGGNADVVSNGISRYASDESVFVRDGHFVDDMGRTFAPVSSLKLPGVHNIDNACAAIAAARHFSLDSAAFERGLAAFMGLEHRLKLIGEVSGVRFYDDSIATTPGSAIAALRAFDGPKVIMLGGSNKGADYTELVRLCHERQAKVVAIGKTGTDIARLCREKDVEVVEMGQADMADSARQAYSLAERRGVVILSPASASFDMFKNYAERGDKFITAVRQLEAQGG